MKACVDVGYCEHTARAACVAFEQWQDGVACAEYLLDIDGAVSYVPGEFYQRELPSVLAVLNQLPVRPDVIVIDGYVWLDRTGRKGLGAHLFEELAESVPIIGVAKTRFAAAKAAVEVFRGSSRRPLFVTAAGVNATEAAKCIRRMHGENRIPTLLKRADQLSRSNVAST